MTETISQLPSIPTKRYFTISEASDLCAVEAHVLRYWEQEFTQLKPIKRRGNRRYYQRHDVLLIRQIKELLYENGYTIKAVSYTHLTLPTKPGSAPEWGSGGQRFKSSRPDQNS